MSTLQVGEGTIQSESERGDIGEVEQQPSMTHQLLSFQIFHLNFSHSFHFQVSPPTLPISAPCPNNIHGSIHRPPSKPRQVPCRKPPY